MGEDFVNPKGVFEKPGFKRAFAGNESFGTVSMDALSSAVGTLMEAGDWRTLLSNYSRRLSSLSRETFAIFVVISRDLQFRWTTHQDHLGESGQLKYEELLPLNADFGERIRTIRAPGCGIRLIDEIALSTGCGEFTLFRGMERGEATLYLYVGGRRRLMPEEETGFSSVTITFDAVIKREFAVGEQLAHATRLSAAIELGRQIGDSALAASFLNRAADTIQKKIGVDYAAVMVLDEGKREIEFAGISESLTPLYDTPLSMKPAGMLLAALGGKEPLILAETENSGYRALGVGVRWAALIPLETHSKRKAILILESRSISPYDDAELKDIEIVSSILSDRLSASIAISEKERKIVLRNMLLQELLLLHRESDPARIAEESLAFIESVVPSIISVFYVLNEARTTLIPVTARGLFAQEMLSFSVPVGEGIVGKAISGDKPELIEDAKDDLRAINLSGTYETESVLLIPIKSIKEDIGVITLHRSGRKGFSPDDLDVISLVARQLSTAMERANASAELRRTISEKETESGFSSQLADEFAAAVADDDAETLPPRILRRCAEISSCEGGMLLFRHPGSDSYRCVALRPSGMAPPGSELEGESMEELKKEGTHFANGLHIIEDNYAVEDACSRLGIRLGSETLGEEPDDAHRCLLICQAETAQGGDAVFIGVGNQAGTSKQIFRGHLLQKLLNFFCLRYARMHDRRVDSEELQLVKKISSFKDQVFAETELGRLLEKIAPAIGEMVDASVVAIYLADFSTSSFQKVSGMSYNGGGEPPESMMMSQVETLVKAMKSRRKVVKVGNLKGDVPFMSLFSRPLLAGRISTLDGVDYVVIAGFEPESDYSGMDKLLAELLKTLSLKVRQLTALDQERHRSGLLNLIDETARNIVRQGEFSKILDALSSAAGHLVGAEYALAGVLSASSVDWFGYYETKIPDSVEKLALKSVEKGEEYILNDVVELRTAVDGNIPGSFNNLAIYPVTSRESELPRIFLLLINKIDGKGFTDNDIWVLERLGADILGSIKTTEDLKQETLKKKKAEMKKAELSELLDGIEGGIVRLDSDGGITFANRQARRIFALSQSDAPPKLASLLSEHDSLQVMDFTDSVKRGEHFEGTYTFLIGGELKRIHISGRQISGRSRRRGMVLIARNEGNTVQETGAGEETQRVSEKHPEIRNMRFALKRGFSYTISEDKPSMAYSTLIDLVGAGFDALVITREHPSKLREKYQMGGSDIRWLTQVVGNNNLDPSKLSVITSAIISFLERHSNAVVFIDGLEYLLANNNTIRVIAMLENVMQKVVDSGAVVIAAINRPTFDQKEFAMIGKMFEEIDVTELKRRYLNRGIEEFTEQDTDSSSIDAND